MVVVVRAAYLIASILCETAGAVFCGLTRLSAVKNTAKTEHKTTEAQNTGFP